MKIKKHILNAYDMGIDTHQEPVVYMRQDCHICRAEGFSSNARVLVEANNNKLIATLNVVRNDTLSSYQIGLSDIVMAGLDAIEGQPLRIAHAPVVNSLGFVRKKIFGFKLSYEEISQIIADISAHNFSDIEIASFLSVCAGKRLSSDEIISLTKAMVSCGKVLEWENHHKVFDKHCIGGLPGNRTTPLVVSIVSAAGLIIPKTSSRAITSPAGTADTMQSLTSVSLSMEEIKRVVNNTGACLAWGGAVNLSPADDMLIRIERALDLDGEGQLIASVLSKKIAAGSTHVIIDIPVGETAKVRMREDAERLAMLFTQVGEACGINVRCLITDGSKPVGYGIGPGQEAKDILAVLNCRDDAPSDLRERSLILAANLFDMDDGEGLESGLLRARSILESGQALKQFNKIRALQGQIKELTNSKYSHQELASTSGVLEAIDNRKLARLAKLAGAPFSLNSGLRLHTNVGNQVVDGEPLFTLFSDSQGEMSYALDYYLNNLDMFKIQG
ncbi:thymidine phosphorylase family protein [Pseudoalteromonas shioyasakiensis]|uniref:thymidine phosphorylase family protein n=1 Tax=Pseudoalteromonas shioyasakiensis TaxID=1190813 RepID=UPI001EFE7591|nr:thymidine phosphorylase family protein [Pseudoalteromonas shioyasakiensis]MCG9733662.1 thymidine phosphorylase family protein [Pseudoalteromonas shioyasakiensis]